MLGFALLMVMAAVVVGYCASRVGASIGRDLRDKTFRNVVQYSNAEMDHFSTASLITRSTNDVQQIQMVTAVFLRMILYAPIIGIGGVIKDAESRGPAESGFERDSDRIKCHSCIWTGKTGRRAV